MNISNSYSRKPLIIAHRGASGYEPENTLLAFGKAIGMGVDMIECDVQVCASGQIIVFHDETVDRITDGIGLVKDLSLEALKNLKLAKNQTIATLQETLDFINGQCDVNIELKGKNSAHTVAEIIKQYLSKPQWHPELFLISSFDKQELIAFKQKMPIIALGYLCMDSFEKSLREAQELNAYSLNLYHPLATKEHIAKAHNHGFKVYVFTVNEPSQALQLVEHDADGLFTDFPDRIADAFQ